MLEGASTRGRLPVKPRYGLRPVRSRPACATPVSVNREYVGQVLCGDVLHPDEVKKSGQAYYGYFLRRTFTQND